MGTAVRHTRTAGSSWALYEVATGIGVSAAASPYLSRDAKTIGPRSRCGTKRGSGSGIHPIAYLHLLGSIRLAPDLLSRRIMIQAVQPQPRR